MQPYTVIVRDVGAIPTLVLREAVQGAERSKFVPSACGAVWAFLRGLGLRGGRNVAFYPDAAIVEAGVDFNGAVVLSNGIQKSELPAGRVAYTLHRGPYGGLGAAHRAVREWCAGQGHVLAGPSWEVYGHWRQEWNTDSSRIETEVYWLLG